MSETMKLDGGQKHLLKLVVQGSGATQTSAGTVHLRGTGQTMLQVTMRRNSKSCYRNSTAWQSLTRRLWKEISMKVDVSEDWCVRMAHLEGDSEIGAGRPDLTGRLRELDKKGYQPLTGAIGEEAATVIDRLRAEAERLKDEDAFSQTVIAEQGRKIDDITQQLAAANGRLERLVAAATPVLRNELDKVEVHPCDYNDDAARARQCTAEVQELLAALSALPQQVNNDARDAERYRYIRMPHVGFWNIFKWEPKAGCYRECNGQLLDAAIDDALSEFHKEKS